MGSKLLYMNKRAKYFWKWPTTLESVWPFVQVLIISYFELCMRMSYILIKTQHILHNHYCAHVCVISHYVTSPLLRSEPARGSYIST